MCSLSIWFRFSLYIYIHPLSRICVFSLYINISILSHGYVFSLYSISFVLYIFILLSQEYMFPLKFKTITSRKYSQHAKQFCVRHCSHAYMRWFVWGQISLSPSQVWPDWANSSCGGRCITSKDCTSTLLLPFAHSRPMKGQDNWRRKLESSLSFPILRNI